MKIKNSGSKGYKTEELLRAYFLRAGFFVLRGVPLKFEGQDLSDIDLWIYERSATLARRRTIVDIKDKQRPQAAERMFFASGLASTIGVEGVGIVTTDKSPLLRKLARKNKVLWVDGDDLQRLKTSEAILIPERLSDELFFEKIDALDKSRGGAKYRNTINTVKSSVGDRFGASSANLALDAFHFFGAEALRAHPRSDSAEVLVRLSFYVASIVAASFDFASAEFALRPRGERRNHMTNLIRFGENVDSTFERITWMETALREYADNGTRVARQVSDAFNRDAHAVPAEDLADIVIKHSNTNALFDIARTLEYSAFRIDHVSYDDLPSPAKGFFGALLDFSKVSRKEFAAAMSSGGWKTSDTENAGPQGEEIEETEVIEDTNNDRLI